MRGRALPSAGPAQEAGGAPGAGAEVPPQPVVQPPVRQAVPLSPWRVAGEQIPYLQPVQGPTPGQSVKSCSPWAGLPLEKPTGDCVPREGPQAGAGQGVRSLPLRGRGGRGSVRDWPSPVPVPCVTGGSGERKWGLTLRAGRRERWGEGGCKIARFRFYFSLSYFYLIGNKFPESRLFCL